MNETDLAHAADQLGLEGLSAFPETDRASILSILTNLFVGFQQRNADLLAGVYTPDADWVNAFGSVKKGSAEVIDYLRGLFDDENFNDGQLVAPPHSTIRQLSDDCAVVSTHLQVSGQGLIGGGAIALRDNHSLHILQKQPDGRWQVVSDMYMDARSDRSYAGHS
ncbi:MAG: SgcJ/EcaC family oxidoreductase [Pseudolysinimonas sp.]